MHDCCLHSWVDRITKPQPGLESSSIYGLILFWSGLFKCQLDEWTRAALQSMFNLKYMMPVRLLFLKGSSHRRRGTILEMILWLVLENRSIRDLSSINCSPFNLVIMVPENSVSGKLMGGKKTLEEVAKRRWWRDWTHIRFICLFLSLQVLPCLQLECKL